MWSWSYVCRTGLEGELVRREAITYEHMLGKLLNLKEEGSA